MLMTLMPLARSPMDKKGGQALSNYAKSVERMLEEAAPWTKSARRTAHLRGKAKPGEVVVVLGGAENADNPLFAGAKITRE